MMNESIELDFDSSIYSVISVQKTCYFFMELISSDIRIENGLIRCTITYRDKITDDLKEQFVSRFRNEVLDNSLRDKISEETSEVRNLILGLAFSKTGFQSE